MSIDTVMSRVEQIQAMLAGVTTTPASSGTAASFSSALADASTSAALSDGSTTTDPTAATATLASLTSPAGGTAAYGTAAATGTTTGGALPASVPYAAQITAAAKANGIDPALLAGMIKQESGFNPNAGSAAGARGLTQLMPSTAAGLGVSNVLDPAQ